MTDVDDKHLPPPPVDVEEAPTVQAPLPPPLIPAPIEISRVIQTDAETSTAPSPLPVHGMRHRPMPSSAPPVAPGADIVWTTAPNATTTTTMKTKSALPQKNTTRVVKDTHGRVLFSETRRKYKIIEGPSPNIDEWLSASTTSRAAEHEIAGRFGTGTSLLKSDYIPPADFPAHALPERGEEHPSLEHDGDGQEGSRDSDRSESSRISSAPEPFDLRKNTLVVHRPWRNLWWIVRRCRYPSFVDLLCLFVECLLSVLWWSEGYRVMLHASDGLFFHQRRGRIVLSRPSTSNRGSLKLDEEDGVPWVPGFFETALYYRFRDSRSDKSVATMFLPTIGRQVSQWKWICSCLGCFCCCCRTTRGGKKNNSANKRHPSRPSQQRQQETLELRSRPFYSDCEWAASVLTGQDVAQHGRDLRPSYVGSTVLERFLVPYFPFGSDVISRARE